MTTRPIMKVRGWWKTGALSLTFSAAIHAGAGLALGLFLYPEPDTDAPQWGVMEIRQTRSAPPEPSLLTVAKRPEIPLPPIEPPWPLLGGEAPATAPPPSEEPPRTPPPPPSARVSPPQAAATSPLPIQNHPPRYPEMARRRGYQGVVIITARVSAEGMPISVAVRKSSGYRVLDRAAKKAVLSWKFLPATRGGKRVKGEVEIPIRFRLTP
ncbi:MAG: energy transducer TonB [Planctomycetota bacterium]|nr:energy transducer TonB [Planctomycetota bacterium]